MRLLDIVVMLSTMMVQRSLHGGAAAFTASRRLLGRSAACTLERKHPPNGQPRHGGVLLLRRHLSFLTPTISLQLAQQEQQHQDPMDTASSNTLMSIRRSALHNSLQRIMHIDPDTIAKANSNNLQQPTSGYDPTFGRSAIKCYRSFLTAGTNKDENDQTRLAAAADRCARQIDHLRRRHLAHSLDWVRHHDNPEKMMTGQDEATPLLLRTQKRFPIIMVLDNLRSAFNVGSLFRTAEACAIQELITVR
jgi:hypothetical protein